MVTSEIVFNREYSCTNKHECYAALGPLSNKRCTRFRVKRSAEVIFGITSDRKYLKKFDHHYGHDHQGKFDIFGFGSAE